MTFKMLRDVASTLAYRKLGRAEYADMVPGHEISTEAKKSTGDVENPQTLQPRIDAITVQYFGAGPQ